ncbi:hypothetical protein GCM10028791_42410 [Echinicola sediminis]
MTVDSLTPSQKIQLKEDLLTTKIGDETVLMTIESGKYFRINKVGTLIWEQLKSPTTAEEIAKTLVNRYKISFEECIDDILPFLNALNKDKLLVHPA